MPLPLHFKSATAARALGIRSTRGILLRAEKYHVSQPKPYLTPEQYLALERTAAYKSEYFRGEIFAMAGVSPTHVLIVTNIVAALHGQLRRRPCTVYATDFRLKVNASGLYTYPDIAVVCGEPQFDDDQRDTLVNPTLLVEVLSESTQDYDRGGKFAQYRKSLVRRVRACGPGRVPCRAFCEAGQWAMVTG